MASITYWNRLEPRPRTSSLTRALSAQVRDPLWMLTRQWQFGEYQGEDAASPAFVASEAETAPLLAWSPEAAEPRPFDRLTSPLEPLAEREPLTPSLALRVELGFIFQRLLAAAVPLLLPDYRLEYRLPRPSETELAALADPDEAAFLRVVAQRSLDGLELYEDIVAAAPLQPVNPPVAPTVLPVLRAFREHVEASFGPIGRTDPEAWKPDRLEYGVSVVATAPGDGNSSLTAHPQRSGNFDWYSFDLAGAAPDASPAPAPVVTTKSSILPLQVRFKGMPNKRFWHFEAGGTDFGDITVDRRDLAKVIVMDFMLVHGNDWFVIPFEMETGTLCRITSLQVHDVFGEVTQVRRADEKAQPGPERWSMYATTRTESDALAAFFLLPPSAGEIALQSAPLERVTLGRDEMANMVWGIEQTTENALGYPVRGHEREQARVGLGPPHVATPPNASPLRYQIQTDVPEHWIPFLPVTVDASLRQVALERGAMLRFSTVPPEPILPLGRILNPAGATYRLREEEVPREGTVVERVVRRARWIDGSTHLWCARKTTVGFGEGQSGLRFDVAIVRPPSPPGND